MLCLGQVLAGAVPLLPEKLARRLLRRHHPFDLRHGTDTGGLMYGPVLVTGHANDQFNEGYYATAPSVFRGLIARWEETLTATPGLSPLEAGDETHVAPLSRYAFIDLGCGKGRVLLLAAELPFRSVTGIELNARLCAAAEENVRRWHRQCACETVRVQCGDVLSSLLLDMPPADLPLLLFLFNSFEADVVRALMQLLTDLAHSRSAPIDLLYVHPDHAILVERTRGVEVLFDGDVPFSREDALADVFGVDVDRCGIYRIGCRSEGQRLAGRAGVGE